ncbi:hypothetical protein [Crateriforma spongiae]|uniref:hypothetical protein n=1 Tax=Crateriforma spongiae TaxID=2724528 RepID=UPI001445B1D3|nr:hypothetical protein [Crateriforma spongiae]
MLTKCDHDALEPPSVERLIDQAGRGIRVNETLRLRTIDEARRRDQERSLRQSLAATVLFVFVVLSAVTFSFELMRQDFLKHPSQSTDVVIPTHNHEATVSPWKLVDAVDHWRRSQAQQWNGGR